MSKPPRTASRTLGGGLNAAVQAAAVAHGGPWLAWFVLPLLAFLLRRWTDGESVGVGLTSAGLTAATLGLAVFAGHLFRARGLSVRVHAVVTLLAAGSWLLLALINGILRTPSPQLWFVGLLVPLTWSMRRIAKGMREGENADGWGEIAEKVKLPRSRVQAIEGDSERVTAKVKVEPGVQTSRDVVAARESIASLVGAPLNGVRVTTEPGQPANEANLTINMRDVLATSTAWPGPSAPGASITAPVLLGVYDDGAPIRVWLPGDEEADRVSTHFLWAGMSGAGKSAGALIFLAECLTRYDCEVWGIDTVKGLQTFGPIADAMDRVVTDRAEAKALVRSLPDLIRERTSFLASQGYTQWVPGCGLRYLVIHMEEFAELLVSPRATVSAARTARGAGVTLSLSTQRTTHTNMPVDVRQQMGTTLCFGLKEGDAVYALSKETLDSGADPEAWGITRPGAVYVENPGIPQVDWSKPARTFKASRDQLAAAVAGRQPGPVSGSPAVFTGPGPDDDDLDDETELVVPPSPEPEVEADPTVDIPADEDQVLTLELPAPVTSVGREEAVARLREYLRRMAEEGHERVKVEQLVEWRRSVGKSRPWLSGELAKLQEAGELEPDPERGAYRLPSPVGAGARP